MQAETTIARLATSMLTRIDNLTSELILQTIIVGTRGSLLATTQTGHAVRAIQNSNANVRIETKIIQTTGDLRRDVPFASVGTKGMFVKEIEQALLDGAIDIGIHSMKDMPGELPPGLQIACIPDRENPYDAFISNEFSDLQSLPTGATVGTSSARRRAQIIRHRPDLNLVELRGNLDTRLRKLDEGAYDAIVVACAGLNRLGLGTRITSCIPPEVCLPAVGQGALAIEIRDADSTTLECVRKIHSEQTARCVLAERLVLSALGGGCSVPIAAFATESHSQLTLTALVASLDGATLVSTVETGASEDFASIGARAAMTLLNNGASDLLAHS